MAKRKQRTAIWDSVLERVVEDVDVILITSEVISYCSERDLLWLEPWLCCDVANLLYRFLFCFLDMDGCISDACVRNGDEISNEVCTSASFILLYDAIELSNLVHVQRKVACASVVVAVESMLVIVEHHLECELERGTEFSECFVIKIATRCVSGHR